MSDIGNRVKKSIMCRIRNALFDDMDFKTMKKHTIEDEIMPWIGDKIIETVDRVIFEFFNPNGNPSHYKRNREGNNNTPYDTISTRRSTNSGATLARGTSSSTRSDLGPFDFREVDFRTRDRAYKYRDRILEAWDEAKADVMTVNGLYSTAWDLNTTNWATTDFGWTSRTDLAKARVFHDRNGWHIDLPDPIEIED